ncbi:MAG TPA: HAD-IA family hydrolase, partial [Gemmataceae bacterium]|nr:HAD-IA family hydrolase [Gemmataceae bacterium]
RQHRNIMIQAIVFDAVGTLIHVQPSVATIYAEVGARFGSRLDADSVQRRFHAAFARQDRLDEEAAWRTSEERERARWRTIVGEVLDDVIDIDGCFDALYGAFAQATCWSCEADAAELLPQLHQRGLRLAMASNFDARLPGVIAHMPALAGLDPIVVSSTVGWRKPAPQFFRAVAESLALPPEAILFVGDDHGNDFVGASEAGMRALLFDPRRRHLHLNEARLDRLMELAIDKCW